jgi:hypothetical protein
MNIDNYKGYSIKMFLPELNVLEIDIFNRFKSLSG